ncbi:MAG TPA: outer membrane protein transport protein [Kofleriaceae bacterium]|nr:outer membrane protein transport protein [Kofleriaceae bacterium]
MALVGTALLLESALPALAGGMQLSTRGVRPTARGGAFVAGADDLGALWFNPAGLAALAGEQSDGEDQPPARRRFLLDVGYVSQAVTYERIDSGNNPRDAVESDAPGLPIPTIGVAFDLGDQLVIGGGLYAPYAGLGRYPETGAQKYSLIDLSESVLLIAEVAVAYQLSDTIRIGAGVQNLIFRMASALVFSGCPGQTVCAPEDPEFDALAKIEMLDVFNPSGVIGAQIDLHEKVRVGAAFQLPFLIKGRGKFATRLPSSGFYDGATVVGDRADIAFAFPPILRAGVEVQPTPGWRAELAASIEFWSIHDEFSITPRNVRIEGAPGVGSYELGPMIVPRNYENSYSINLGLEGQPLADLPLSVLGGYGYETAAAPDAYLSVLTVDGAKHLFAGGIGYGQGAWRLNATLAHVKVETREVTAAEGMSPQLQPVRDNPDDPDPARVYVNWGTYQSSWLIAGLALDTSF